MGILIAYLLGILSAIKKQNQNSPASHSESTNERRDCPPHPFIAEVRFPESVERERRAYEEKQYSTQKRLVIATWFTFAAVFIYAGLTLAIWIATKRAADATRESVIVTSQQFRADQRAWLSVVVTSEKPRVGKNMQIRITLKNTGKTPAINTRLCSVTAITDDPNTLPVFRSYQDSDCAGPAVIAPSGGIGEFTHAVFDPHAYLRGLSKRHIEALARADASVWNYGDITYADIFGCKHWRRYCLERAVFLDKTSEWVTCPRYNEVDVAQECAK